MNKLKQESVYMPRLFADVLWRIGYGVALIGLSVILFFVIPFLQDADAYTTAMALSFIAMYVLAASALALLIAGRRLNKLLRSVGKFWVGIIAASVLFLGYGLLQDFYGSYCVGFFGVQTPCVHNQSFVWLILFFNPYSFFTLVGLSLLGLLKGWADYIKKRPGSIDN